MAYRNKKEILQDYPELELTAYGDFVLKKELLEKYKIFDSHAHLYLGTRMLAAKYEVDAPDEVNMDSSFFDLSFFSRNIGKFDLEEEFFKRHPERIISPTGLGYLVDVIASVEGMMRSSRQATVPRLLRDMGDSSVAASVILPLSNPDNMEGLDRYFSELAKHDNLIPFGSVHPLDRAAEMRIKYSVERGARGFKLHPAFWKIALDDEEVLKLIEMIAATGLPIISCSGIAFPEKMLNSRFLPPFLRGGAQFQLIERFRRVALRFPETDFILAHGGGGLNGQVIALMEECGNVFTDISSQPAMNVKAMVERLGDDRLFYGSDYPVWNQAFSQLTILKAVKSEESRKKIFGENIKRLLGLNERL